MEKITSLSKLFYSVFFPVFITCSTQAFFSMVRLYVQLNTLTGDNSGRGDQLAFRIDQSLSVRNINVVMMTDVK